MKMKVKNYILLIKILICVTGIVFIGMLITIVRADCAERGTEEYEQKSRDAVIMMGAGCGMCGLVVILTAREIKLDPKKIDKYTLLYADEEQIRHCIQQRLIQNEYKNAEDSEDLLLYYRKYKGRYQCTAVYFQKMLEPDQIFALEERIYSILSQRERSLEMRCTQLTVCVVVRKVSPAFYKVLQDPIDQQRRLHKYYTGATLGGMIFYLPALDEDMDMGPGDIKHMRREALELWKEQITERKTAEVKEESK